MNYRQKVDYLMRRDKDIQEALKYAQMLFGNFSVMNDEVIELLEDLNERLTYLEEKCLKLSKKPSKSSKKPKKKAK